MFEVLTVGGVKSLGYLDRNMTQRLPGAAVVAATAVVAAAAAVVGVPQGRLFFFF